MSLKVEYLRIDEIESYERNARTHSPEQVQQLVNSIQEFGFTNPVLIDNNNVLIAGHGRLVAAAEFGMTEVPAIQLQNLTDKQVKALRIADNQLALNASWDLDLLAAELSDLDADSFELDLLGFDDDFLAGLLPEDPTLPSEQSAEQPEQAEATEKVEVIIGPYKFAAKKTEWQKWETSIRAKVGLDVESVTAELKKRLGFKE